MMTENRSVLDENSESRRLPALDDVRVAVIGLGYVGLPLAVAFGRVFDTLGFDVKRSRIEALRRGEDATRETSVEALRSAVRLRFSWEPSDLADRNAFIVAVPTPVDAFKRPDFSLLEKASVTIGRVLRPGGVVVYESTVYPGATEEVCVPVLERESKLVFNRDFFVGYSPERINPGDREHRLETIRKVVAGSTPETLDFVDALYRRIVPAGTFRASSLRVAEAAKVIENTQRDVNIALINELAMIFNRMGIDTAEVLEAAGTKWNFLPFRPGLVGGHCIGVDPYYLTHKAQQIGYHPEMILAGRRINDNMGVYVAGRVIRLMIERHIHPHGARVLVLGLTFKENCPDTRNTRVVDLVSELQAFGARVEVYDPWADPEEVETEYGFRPIAVPEEQAYDAVVLAVAHRQFRDLGAEGVRRLLRTPGVVYDVKHVLPREVVDGRL